MTFGLKGLKSVHRRARTTRKWVSNALLHVAFNWCHILRRRRSFSIPRTKGITSQAIRNSRIQKPACRGREGTRILSCTLYLYILSIGCVARIDTPYFFVTSCDGNAKKEGYVRSTRRQRRLTLANATKSLQFFGCSFVRSSLLLQDVAPWGILARVRYGAEVSAQSKLRH